MYPSRFLVTALLALGLPACDTEEDDTGTNPVDDTGADTGTPDTSPPPVDDDGDGYTSDVDCDDHNYQVWPGAPELCDGLDNDCDGSTDEDYDGDGDGHVIQTCMDGDDCDDSDPGVYPGAEEIPYDGIDQDCSGADLDDVDGDGFRSTKVGGNDCDDANPAIHPRATEIPKNGIDEDCNGGDDIDGDDDGYGDEAWGGDDCDDADPSVHPGATDWMNDALDADCDGKEPGLQSLDAAPVLIDGTETWDDLVGFGIDACDFDEDGLDDLVVGAPFASSYHGQVGIFYGSGADAWGAGMGMADADVLVEGNSYDFIGFDPRCGDVDGDGHADLVLGRGEIDYSPYVTTFGLLIYYGTGRGFSARLGDADADAELSLRLGAPTGGNNVYDSEFALGDIDGDGADDVVLEWPFDTLHGDAEILVLPGARYDGAIALDDRISGWMVPDQPYTGGSTWVQQVQVLEDLDGDGLLDIVAAEPYWSDTIDTADTAEPYSREGRASFLSGFGEAAGETLSELAHAVLTAEAPWTFLGFSAATGDFDADGAADGALGGIGDSTGGDTAGGLWMWSDFAGFLGTDPTSPTASASAHVYGTWADGGLGLHMDAAGDLDGDGFEDLLVCEPSAAEDQVGRVWVVSGALLSGVAAVEDVALFGVEGTSSDNGIGSALLGGADFDGDDRPDVALAALNWDPADDPNTFSGRVAIWLSSRW